MPLSHPNPAPMPSALLLAPSLVDVERAEALASRFRPVWDDAPVASGVVNAPEQVPFPPPPRPSPPLPFFLAADAPQAAPALPPSFGTAGCVPALREGVAFDPAPRPLASPGAAPAFQPERDAGQGPTSDEMRRALRPSRSRASWALFAAAGLIGGLAIAVLRGGANDIGEKPVAMTLPESAVAERPTPPKAADAAGADRATATDNAKADKATVDAGKADKATADVGKADKATADVGKGDKATVDAGKADKATADVGKADAGEGRPGATAPRATVHAAPTAAPPSLPRPGGHGPAAPGGARPGSTIIRDFPDMP